MAADWHPANGFEQLVTRLVLSASYVSAARYPTEERDIIDIGLCVIKRCGIYTEEYKAWIGMENAGQLASPRVKQTLDSFKGFWSNAITLVNQTSVPASQNGYGMVAVDNNGGSIASYGESLANFGAAYAATQETVKSQADSLAAIQAQLAGLQQFCMAVGQQQPPPNNIYYAPQQQQRCHNNSRNNRGGRGGSGGGFNGNGGGYSQQPASQQGQQSGGRGFVRPTPYKRHDNWNYCHTHGSDVKNGHTSATCNRQGPDHNPNAMRANMMGGLPAGMHKTILPSTTGRTPPPHRQQQQQQQPPGSYYPTQNTWQQPPAQFGQRFTMAMPTPQQDAAMMNFVGQFPPSALTPQQQMTQQQQPDHPLQQQPNQCSFPPFQQFRHF